MVIFRNPEEELERNRPKYWKKGMTVEFLRSTLEGYGPSKGDIAVIDRVDKSCPDRVFWVKFPNAKSKWGRNARYYTMRDDVILHGAE